MAKKTIQKVRQPKIIAPVNEAAVRRAANLAARLIAANNFISDEAIAGFARMNNVPVGALKAELKRMNLRD